MRKLLLVLPLLLTGCWVTAAQVQSLEDRVAKATTVLCGFVPVVSSIEPLLAVNPTAIGVTALASAICGVVTKQGGHKGWVLHGVPIRGHFIR